MDELDRLDVERKGAIAGFNPMFGEWRQTFNFEPVSYSNKGEARMEFKHRVREVLNTHFVFTGHVALTATLYLEEQKLFETPAYGDLDNYSKSLLDSLKGLGAPLIDDCQVNRLDISWVDVPHTPRFEVELHGSPDDFALIPLRLFEMPDGLYYPISMRAWSLGEPQEMLDRDIEAMLQITAEMTSAKRALRHNLRKNGVPQFRAFQYAKYVSPTLIGFHPTRVTDSGFEMVKLNEWST